MSTVACVHASAPRHIQDTHTRNPLSRSTACCDALVHGIRHTARYACRSKKASASAVGDIGEEAEEDSEDKEGDEGEENESGNGEDDSSSNDAE